MRFEDLTRTVVDRSPHEPPPVAVIAARAHRRTVRRRTAIGLVCAAFLVLGVAGAGALTSSEDHVQLMTDPPPGSAPGTTVDPDSTDTQYSIDLSGDLGYGRQSIRTGGRIVVPSEVVIIDDDTVAMAWTAQCNEPADVVFVQLDDLEIRLVLSLTQIPVTDCVGEPDHWTATFDLKDPIGDRRVMAGEVGPGQQLYNTVSASSDGRNVPADAVDMKPAVVWTGTTPITVPDEELLPASVAVVWSAEPEGGHVTIESCVSAYSVRVWRVGNVVVPDVRIAPPEYRFAEPEAPCGPAGASVEPEVLEGRRMIGFEE